MRRRDRVDAEKLRFSYKGEKASTRTKMFLKILKTFSGKNEGFEVLKLKRNHVLIFKTFLVKNERFEVLKLKKDHVLIFKDFLVKNEGFNQKRIIS